MVPLFLIPIIVGLTTQFSKRFFNKRWWSNVSVGGGVKLPRYGGMPSAHTAFAISLMTTAWLVDGWYSMTFAITSAVTIFILDDALRMRMFLGRHGLALHQLIQSLPAEEQKNYPALETQLGHKPAEVLVGAIVGFIFSFVLYQMLVL